jgi:hypothetical protein
MHEALQELPAGSKPLVVYVCLNVCLMSLLVGYGLAAGSLGLVVDGVVRRLLARRAPAE